MKKLPLLILLFLLSITGQCFGQWKLYSDETIYEIYIDYSRIETEGIYKSIWSLTNNKHPSPSPSGKKYKSSVRKQIVDCPGSRIQLVNYFDYSEKMGKGEIVNSRNFQIDESAWHAPPHISGHEGIIKVACTQKQTSPSAVTTVVPKPKPNPQDVKRQRCTNLGLLPNSADFQQCVN